MKIGVSNIVLHTILSNYKFDILLFYTSFASFTQMINCKKYPQTLVLVVTGVRYCCGLSV